MCQPLAFFHVDPAQGGGGVVTSTKTSISLALVSLWIGQSPGKVEVDNVHSVASRLEEGKY